MTGIFILLLLSACASGPQTRQLLQAPPTTIQSRVELDRVPFFPQRKYQCGPAALATVLNHQGVSIRPNDLTARVYIPKRKGSLQIEMVAAGRGQGLLAYRLAPDLTALLKEVDHGNPVLVFQNLSFSFWPQWHYAVVVGYDLSAAELVLRSGAQRRHRVGFSTFERTWQRAGHWAYVFVRPGAIPVTANPLAYTRAAHDLQRSGFSSEALLAFEQGAEKWPDQSLVLMALANAEFAAGNTEAAERIFRRELKLRPGNASAWNNLAYALSAKNCNHRAIEAISCAALLSPQDDNIQQSVVEIKAMSMKLERKASCDEGWGQLLSLCRELSAPGQALE